MTNKWNYKKVGENQEFRPDTCEQLIGQSDGDIEACKEVAYLKVNAPSGKSSLYCRDHAAQRLLGWQS
jgi:hypothetical protein